MRDVTVQGWARLARNFGPLPKEFSLLQHVFRVSEVREPLSVRTKLESDLVDEREGSFSECIYAGKIAYRQVWSHITVRIQLIPDADVSASTMATLRDTWKRGIEDTWGGKWGVGAAGELPCRVSFEVQYTSDRPHHTVRVRTGTSATRSNQGLWDTADGARTAAHEFGHMLGHPDEYTDSGCPARSPANTGTVMNGGTAVPARLMAPFATNINAAVIAFPG